MTELQSLATSAFFKNCQKEAATYVEEDIMVVKGRETADGTTTFKLVPPPLFYTQGWLKLSIESFMILYLQCIAGLRS